MGVREQVLFERDRLKSSALPLMDDQFLSSLWYTAVFSQGLSIQRSTPSHGSHQKPKYAGYKLLHSILSSGVKLSLTSSLESYCPLIFFSLLSCK